MWLLRLKPLAINQHPFPDEPLFAMFISGLAKTAIIDHGSDSYVNRSDSAFALVTAFLQRFHALPKPHVNPPAFCPV
jgi:hypothetical protein